jgi:hypothetical protein
VDYTLNITFRVRRKVTLGAEALLHGRVVSATGIRHFKPSHGALALVLSRSDWPTKVKFVMPAVKQKAGDRG